MPSQISPRPAFACLKLSDRIVEQLGRFNIDTPTPIQEQSIRPIIEGCDLIGIAQTGTGKTFAFGLPMLDRLLGTDEVGLILAPTRELAIQIDEELKKIGAPFGLKTAVLIGGAPMNRQVNDIRRRPHLIIATPGRLKDHLYQRTMGLRNVAVVVLDEADRMFDMGFAPAVRSILDQAPTDRQTLLFSATMPQDIIDLTTEYLRDPVTVEVTPQGTPSELVDQEAHVIAHENKNDLLADVLDTYTGTILVFSRTRHGARKVAKAIRTMGHSAAELHSDRTLAQRKEAMQGFKQGGYRILVATDIAARGIDVKDIELVVNYDLPDHLEDYIHRIGRTGRAGSLGKAITFTLPNQVRDIKKLEKIIGKEILLVQNGAPVKRERVPERTERPVRNDRPARSDANPSRPARNFDGPRPEKRPWRENPPANQERTEKPRWEDRPKAARPDQRPARFRGNDRPANSDRPGRPAWNDRSERPNFNGDRPKWQDRNSNTERPNRPNRDGERPAWNNRDRKPNFENEAPKRSRPDFGNDRPVWKDRAERPARDERSGDRPARPNYGDQRPTGPKDRSQKPRWEDRTKNTERPGKPFAPRPDSAKPQGKPGRPKPSGTPKKFKKKPGQSFVKNPKSAPAKKFGRK